MQGYRKSLAVVGIIGLCLIMASGQTLRNPEQFYARGAARLEKGDLEGALADFNKALEILPKYSAAWSGRGSVKKKMGDTEGALADYTRAIELTPEIAVPYYSRGFLLLEKKDYDSAIKDFDKALEIQPSLAIVYRNRGDARKFKEISPELLPTTGRCLRLSHETLRSYSSAAHSDRPK